MAFLTSVELNTLYHQYFPCHSLLYRVRHQNTFLASSCTAIHASKSFICLFGYFMSSPLFTLLLFLQNLSNYPTAFAQSPKQVNVPGKINNRNIGVFYYDNLAFRDTTKLESAPIMQILVWQRKLSFLPTGIRR